MLGNAVKDGLAVDVGQATIFSIHQVVEQRRELAAIQKCRGAQNEAQSSPKTERLSGLDQYLSFHRMAPGASQRELDLKHGPRSDRRTKTAARLSPIIASAGAVFHLKTARVVFLRWRGIEAGARRLR